MKIRAHHLLCIQGFQGHGYSKEFVENMSEVIEFLKSSPDQRIQITAECDMLCRCCPYNKDDICAQNPDSEEKIREMDLNVLEIIELDINTILKADDAFQLVKKRINSANINKICPTCEWKNKCLFFNLKINLKKDR